MVEVYAILNQEASTVANKLVDEMFCRFSLPYYNIHIHVHASGDMPSHVNNSGCMLNVTFHYHWFHLT